MKWTFDDYRHYSTEHLQKAEKRRVAREGKLESMPRRRGVQGKRRPTTHSL
ncbi:MAG: hypothetical protein AAF846_16450 [Chloroflexota bacterium]